MTTPRIGSAIRASVVLFLLATGTSAQAQTAWLPGTDGVWFDANNWISGGTTPFPPPNAAGAWAAFGSQAGNPTRTITVDGAATVGRLSFTSSFGYTLSSGSITLDNTGGIPALIENTGGGTSAILTPVTIGGTANAVTLNNTNAANTNPPAGALTLASLGGSGSSVTVNAAATATNGSGLVVIQSGTYGGAGSVTELRGGTLRADEGTGLPSNTLLRINGTAGSGEFSGAFWEVTQNTTVTRTLGSATGNIQVLGTVSGFSATSGTLTLRFNDGGQIQWGSANFNPTTALQFGGGATAASQSGDYVLENGIDLNGAVRTIRVGSAGGGQRAHVRVTGDLVNSSGTASGFNASAGFIQTPGSVLELSGVNTYNGPTRVSGFTALRANEGAGLSPNTNILMTNGVIEGLGATTFSRSLGTAPGQIRFEASSTTGFSAFGGTHTIQLNGGTGTIAWQQPEFFPAVFLLGNVTANALTDFRNGLDLNGGARVISVFDNPNSASDVARVSGVISNSSGASLLLIGGNGVLELTAANTYNGRTVAYEFQTPTLTGGVLRLVGSGSFANSPSVSIGRTHSLDVTGLTGGANYSAAAGRFLVVPSQTLAGSGSVIGHVLVGAGATIRGGNRDGARRSTRPAS